MYFNKPFVILGLLTTLKLFAPDAETQTEQFYPPLPASRPGSPDPKSHPKRTRMVTFAQTNTTHDINPEPAPKTSPEILALETELERRENILSRTLEELEHTIKSLEDTQNYKTGFEQSTDLAIRAVLEALKSSQESTIQSCHKKIKALEICISGQQEKIAKMKNKLFELQYPADQSGF